MESCLEGVDVDPCFADAGSCLKGVFSSFLEPPGVLAGLLASSWNPTGMCTYYMTVVLPAAGL